MQIRNYMFAFFLLMAVKSFVVFGSITPGGYYSWIFNDSKVCNEVFPKYVDANKDGKTWKYYGDCLCYEFSSTMAADDWLISEPINFIKGHKYLVEIGVRCAQTQYPERIEVFMRESLNEYKDSTCIIERTDVNWIEYKNLSGEYYVALTDETPTYQLLVHACSDPDMQNLFFKTLAITDLGLAEVDQPKLTLSDLGFANEGAVAGCKNTVNVTVTNNDSEISDDFVVNFDFGTDITQSISCIPLNPGESRIVSAQFTPTLFEQEYNITATINDGNEQSEHRSTAIDGVLIRPPHAAPLITEITVPIRYQAIVHWIMPDKEQEMALSENTPDPGNLRGFNIYRNQQRIGYVSSDYTSYLDSNTSTVDRAEYHVNAVYENGISDVSNSMVIDVKTSVDDIASDNNDMFDIMQGTVIFNSTGIASLTDICGRTVMHKTTVQTGTSIKLAPGLYVLTISGKTFKIKI